MLTLWWGWKFCRWQAVGPSPQWGGVSLRFQRWSASVWTGRSVNSRLTFQFDVWRSMFTFTSCIKDVHPHMNVWVCYAWRINVFVEGCVFIYFFIFYRQKLLNVYRGLNCPHSHTASETMPTAESWCVKKGLWFVLQVYFDLDWLGLIVFAWGKQPVMLMRVRGGCWGCFNLSLRVTNPLTVLEFEHISVGDVSSLR